MEDPFVIDCFSHLQILIGPNNAGKTNVLDAIELFFSPNLDPERFYDTHSDLSITISLSQNDTLTINYKSDERSFVLNGEPASGRDERILKAQKRIIRVRPELSAHKLITEKLHGFAGNHPQEYSEFCATLQEYFDDIELSERLFLDNIQTDHHERPVGRLGSGFQRLFIILFYLFHPEYDIILIDEAELHLHPSVIKRFVKILETRRASKQVFLTTHSSVFVQPRTILHLWRVARDENHNTQIRHLANCKEEFTPTRLVQELNDDTTEMFFADTVLLVEGVSDKILLRGLIDRFYKGKRDIKVIYTGGKGNMDVYVEVCNAFHIPYTILLDRDALKGVWANVVSRVLDGNHKALIDKKIAILSQHHIYILDGVLEQSYPKKYRKRETKPLNALCAAQMITEEDLASSQMKVIREMIEKL